jgi:hypothetical protein
MENQETASETPSWSDRMISAFSSPSEAFDGLRGSPGKASLWLFPFSLFMILTVVFIYVLYSNETLRTQVFDVQAQAMQKAVDEGNMTQTQFDNARQGMEQVGAGLFLLFGSLPAMFFIAVYFFGGGLFLWLASKIIMKSSSGYMKHVEVYGIASWIGVLGYLVTILMVVGMETIFASPGAGLAIADYDPLNTTHKIISSLNIFSIWMAFVVGIGISKLADKPASSGLMVSFGLWIVWLAIAIPLGLVR